MATVSGISNLFVSLFTCMALHGINEENLIDSEIYKFPKVDLNDTYDFIIIGAGTAGSVLANRLSEISEWKILLVEAGGEENIISDTPVFAKQLWNTDKDWNYTTVEQKNACREVGGLCTYPRGHILGGSSSINYMVHVRGNKLDYDMWEQQGNQGWSYDNVLPYFIKSEDMRIKALSTSKYHSSGGYLTIEENRHLSPLQNNLIKAGEELGFVFNPDYNGQNQTGISHIQYNMREGSRCSAAKAFLSTIKNRTNIHISKSTTALKLMLNDMNNGIQSVQLKLKDESIRDVKVNKEIIVSAGAINSPKLLMLSGIGPKEQLAKHGIVSKVNLPVGKNLVDHVGVTLFFELNNTKVMPTKKKVENIASILDYINRKTGPLTSPLGITAVGHFTLNGSNDDPPDIQVFINTFASFYFDRPIIMISAVKLRPKSVGTVELTSSNSKDPPLIDPRYFEHPDDFNDAVKGCQLLLKFIKTKALSEFNPQLFTEESPCSGLRGVKFCKCAVTTNSKAMYHPVSTVRMSSDGVVSNELRVWGIKNLRVIDASIMPNITSGNTNAPVIMIAEKASDIIKMGWGVK